MNEGKAYLNCVQHYLWAVHVETEQLSWAWWHAICHWWNIFWSLGKVKICPQGTSGGCVCIVAWWWDRRLWFRGDLGGLDPTISDRLQCELLGWSWEVLALRDSQPTPFHPPGSRMMSDDLCELKNGCQLTAWPVVKFSHVPAGKALLNRWKGILSWDVCAAIHAASLVLLANCFLSSASPTSPFIILCLTWCILVFQNEHYLFVPHFSLKIQLEAWGTVSVLVKLWRKNSPEPRKWLPQRVLKSLWD